VVAFSFAGNIDGTPRTLVAIQRFDADGNALGSAFTLPPRKFEDGSHADVTGSFDGEDHPIIRPTSDGGFLVGAVANESTNGFPANVFVQLYKYDIAGRLVASVTVPHVGLDGLVDLQDVQVAPDGEVFVNIVGVVHDAVHSATDP